MQICKACNVVKPLSAFPLRKWKTQQGEAREGPRKECYECQRAADNLRYNAPGSQKRKRHLQYNEENRESLRAYRESYYQANREKWLDRDNGWRFSDRAQAYDSAYRERPEVREATRVRGADWRANNKPRLLVKTRARQAHVARATPAWADLAAIQAIYDEAARLTRETGIKHEVDHYFPLTSRLVCGLHVETNLRVITATENRKKANKLPE